MAKWEIISSVIANHANKPSQTHIVFRLGKIDDGAFSSGGETPLADNLWPRKTTDPRKSTFIQADSKIMLFKPLEDNHLGALNDHGYYLRQSGYHQHIYKQMAYPDMQWASVETI